MTPEDFKQIREICREESRSAQVSRPGLYLMVFFIFLNTCSPPKMDQVKQTIHLEK